MLCAGLRLIPWLRGFGGWPGFWWLTQCFSRAIARAWAILVIIGHKNHANCVGDEMSLTKVQLAVLFSKFFELVITIV